MTRWKLTIEYSGTGFSGWQRQDGVSTIQAAIENAITKFCGQDIPIHAAGRTDAGVHAKGQIAHFDLDYGDRSITGFELAKAINAHLLPQPIAILKAENVHPEFHARFDAQNKLYRYRILQRPAMSALEKNRMWHIRHRLNLEAMQDSARHLLGHHDFTTFRDSQCQAKSSLRTLDSLNITSKPYDDSDGLEIHIEAQAQSFLHHQVRNMVGSLSLVGLGKWSPQDMKTALDAKDRKAGGPTAPATGLYLVRIDYPNTNAAEHKI